MIEIGILLGSYQLARVVGELTGVIESIGVKVDRLSASELQAAFRALDQAQRAGKERKSILREARTHLNKAISLEKAERLAAAYLALAVTHAQLGDRQNVKHILQEFLDVVFISPISSAMLTAAMTNPVAALTAVAVAEILLPGLGRLPLNWAAAQMIRERRIADIKDAVQHYLDEADG
jgi:hypothetical protein